MSALATSLPHVSALLADAREARAGAPNARAAWRTVAALSPKMGGAAHIANDTDAAPDAFRRIFDQHAGYIVDRLRWLGVPDRDRPDVAQEVFIKVARALPSFDPTRPARPWLLVITLHTARDYFLSARVQREQLCFEDVAPLIGADDRTVDRLDAASTVRRAFASLCESHREVLSVVALNEHTAPEAAKALGLSVTMIEGRFTRARKALAAAVGRLNVRGRS